MPFHVLVVCRRNAVIGALMSRLDLPVPVENMLMIQSSTSCSSDLLTTCDISCPMTATPTANGASGTVDVSDISVTLSVPVATVGSLSPAVDNNQAVSSLVSISIQ